MFGLLGLVVAIAWFYAYRRVKLKAFGVLGLAVLIGVVGQLITPVLMGFTDIDVYIIRSYSSTIARISAIVYMILALYGVSSIIKSFERTGMR
ncbi:MAG: hypothetical protein R6U44_00310 [Archaeoglobaceae archaeon]